ncbi:MAG: DUF1461 domain-containing protein [Candidatus Woesearchaeota archaeon]
MINLIKLKKIISPFLIFFFVFLLVFGVPSFVSLSPLYFHHVKNTGASEALADAGDLYLNVHDFLLLKDNLDSNFTSGEASHMVDVRILFNVFRFGSLFFLSLILFYFVLVFKTNNFKFNSLRKFNSRKFSKKELSDFKNLCLDLFVFFKKLKIASIIALGLFLFLLFVILIDFGSVFNVFHVVFFPQGNWIFPMDSLLITLFPASFFMSFAKNIFIISFAVSSLILFFSYYFSGYLKKRNRFILQQ